MLRTIVDRIGNRIHEAAKCHLARCRYLVGVVAGIGDSLAVPLHAIVSRFQGKANFMSQHRRRQSFFP